MRETTTQSEVQEAFGLTDPEVAQCPFPYYDRIHRSGKGACPVPGIGWAVLGYEEMLAAAKDPTQFSSRWQSGGDGQQLMGVSTEPYSDEVKQLLSEYPHRLPNALIVVDAPLHTRHRALVTTALNARRVKEMEPSIRQVVNDLIDAFIEDGRCEFMSQFAEMLPSTVISDALGIDRADVLRFKQWSNYFVSGFLEPLDNEARAEVARAVIDFQKFMLNLIAERRIAPGTDLLSGLVTAEIDDVGLDGEQIEGPRSLTDPELLTIMTQLVAGGHHTTAGLIGNAMTVLVQNPELMAEICADHDLIPDFLEETLRLESPVQCTFRRTTTDVQVGDDIIPAETTIAAMWGAANQDPDTFEEPRTFNLRREHVRRHLAFGQGPHFCVGAALARLDTRVAFETLLTRLDDIQLAAGSEPEYHLHFATRGLKRLPIEFRKAR